MDDSNVEPLEDDANVSKSTNKIVGARKVHKKQARALDILKKDCGIVESGQPGKVCVF